jgi:hypothetical protein
MTYSHYIFRLKSLSVLRGGIVMAGKKLFPYVIIITAVLLSGILIFSAGEVFCMEINKEVSTTVPPIDRKVPENIETATFALG